MHALTPLETVWSRSPKASPAKTRALGNFNASRDLDKGDERRADLPKTDCKSKLRLDVELVCQAGTKSHDPFWDGPRLAPAFVTQLLGQVMDKERNGLVRRPYETLAGKSAALLDESF